MYDWANSAMVVVIVSAVFPIYYANVAGAELAPAVATFRFTMATTIGLFIAAVLAPVLGAIADYRPVKKRLLGTFMGLGVTAIAMMYFIQRGDWILASVLFILANLGANGSYVFYDALLPHVARKDEIDRVSTAGYALGYLGGGLLLAASLVVIMNPGLVGLPAGAGVSPEQATLPARLSFLAVAIWWLLFSIPLLRGVPEPPTLETPDDRRSAGYVGIAFTRLNKTFGELRTYKMAFLMLVAFLIYNDGIGTIVRMAGIYGAEIGIDQGAVIGAFVMVQFVGVPFAFLFGGLAGKLGAKRCILFGLALYCGITVFGYFMRTATHFFLLAGLVAMVQGGTQALSRSLFASMIPHHMSGEFFGFFAVFEKFAGIMGPAIFGATLALTGSSRNSILAVSAFFVIGGALLLLVDVEEGQRAAREVDARMEALAEETVEAARLA